jgi:hypothetical protein
LRIAILASAAVTSIDPTTGTPTAFAYQTISLVTLAADTTYYIAESVPVGGTIAPVLYGVGDLMADSAITYDGNVYSESSGATPTSSVGGFSDGFFGPDFNVTVPEPSTLALAALFGVGMLKRRRR